MVSCFKSLSHFGFIFVHAVRMYSSFTDLHAAVQFSQYYLLKRLSFSHFLFLPPLPKINFDHRYLGLLLGSLFCSTGLHVCFVCFGVFCFVLFCFCLFRATPVADGGSQV